MLLVELAGGEGLRHLARLRLDKGDERDHPAIDEPGENRDDHEEANETWQRSPQRWKQPTTASLTDCNNCRPSQRLRNIAPGFTPSTHQVPTSPRSTAKTSARPAAASDWPQIHAKSKAIPRVKTT